jgi:hypothetical protein
MKRHPVLSTLGGAALVYLALCGLQFAAGAPQTGLYILASGAGLVVYLVVVLLAMQAGMNVRRPDIERRVRVATMREIADMYDPRNDG